MVVGSRVGVTPDDAAGPVDFRKASKPAGPAAVGCIEHVAGVAAVALGGGEEVGVGPQRPGVDDLSIHVEQIARTAGTRRSCSRYRHWWYPSTATPSAAGGPYSCSRAVAVRALQ